MITKTQIDHWIKNRHLLINKIFEYEKIDLIFSFYVTEITDDWISFKYIKKLYKDQYISTITFKNMIDWFEINKESVRILGQMIVI